MSKIMNFQKWIKKKYKMDERIKERVEEIEKLIELWEEVHTYFCESEAIGNCSICNDLKDKIEQRIEEYGRQGFFNESLEDDLLKKITIL